MTLEEALTVDNQTKNIATPFFITDLNMILEKYKAIQQAFSEFEVYYAMKANPQTEIIEKLRSANACFEITSSAELDVLEKNKIASEKIICMNPIKSEEMLKHMYSHGIRMFAVDSIHELIKIERHAHDSNLLLRVIVENAGSDWPLTKKYGVLDEEVTHYLQTAKEMGLKIVGLTTHVGSQCHSLENWENAVKTCANIYNNAQRSNFNLEVFSLGGGIPILHTKEIPTLKEIANTVTKAIDDYFISKPRKLTIEPGRGVVGDATLLVTSIIGIAERQGKNWAYLDAGVFHGLMETIEKFQYQVISMKSNIDLTDWVLAGPSCDSVDIIMEDVKLPSNLDINDRIFILNTGAYTNVYGTNFNGFKSPATLFK